LLRARRSDQRRPPARRSVDDARGRVSTYTSSSSTEYA
jgi:hypothetical protein